MRNTVRAGLHGGKPSCFGFAVNKSLPFSVSMIHAGRKSLPILTVPHKK